MSALHYLYVFIQSNLIEIPVYYWFYRKLATLGSVARLVTLSNLITHPIVFFVLMAMNRNYIESILIAEAFAVVTEAILHRSFLSGVRGRLTFDASFVANLVSWQLAPLLTYWLLLIGAG